MSWYCRKVCYFTITIVSAYMVCSDDITSIVRKYQHAMCTLAYCSKVELCTSPPQGCAILTVSDKCEVHLLLKVCAAVASHNINLTLCWKYQAHAEHYSLVLNLGSLEFMSHPAVQIFCFKCLLYTRETQYALIQQCTVKHYRVQAADFEM